MPAPRRPYLALPSPWLVAHRGGSLLAPENTFVAFDGAVALGADAIETDVRRTRDGVVVVFHDDTTERLTGARGTVEERALAEIQALDAAFRFTLDGGRTHPHRGAGVRVPTLAETFARYPAMRFSLDAKSRDPRLAEALAAAIRDARAEDRVCIGSFHDEQAERLGRLLPSSCRFLPQRAATLHVLAAHARLPGAVCPRGYDVAALPPRHGRVPVVTRRTVAHFHRLGMPVHVWTIDDEAEMRALLECGVDAIITDRPDVLASVLGRGRDGG
jgi:glycerophosphoryl diester phosphodiesterase